MDFVVRVEEENAFRGEVTVRVTAFEVESKIGISTASSVETRFVLGNGFGRISQVRTVRFFTLNISVIMSLDHVIIERVSLEFRGVFAMLLGTVHFRLFFDVPGEAFSIFVKKLKMLLRDAKKLRDFSKFLGD